MAQIQPFEWFPQQDVTPQSLAATQSVRDALLASANNNPKTMWEGIQSASAKIGGSLLNQKVVGDYTRAQKDYADKFAGMGDNPSLSDIEAMASNPFANQGQSSIVQALLAQKFQLQSPDAIAQRALLASEIAKNQAETGMYTTGGAAVGSPIQDAHGNYFVGTQYGGMRPVSPNGGGSAPSGDGGGAISQGAASVVDPVGSSAVPAQADPSANPQFLTPADLEAAKTLAAKTAEVKAGLPEKMVAAKTALDQLDQSDTLVNGFIDQALKQANGLSTGWVGKLSEAVAGTPAYQLARTLDTVKANIGFDKLNAMRAASPSGGALGQVSNFEEQLLQSVLGSLDQGQDSATIVANLNRLKGFIASNSDQRKSAFNADFGGVQPRNGDASFNTGNTSPSKLPTPQTPADFASLRSGDHYIDPDDGNEYVKP